MGITRTRQTTVHDLEGCVGEETSRHDTRWSSMHFGCLQCHAERIRHLFCRTAKWRKNHIGRLACKSISGNRTILSVQVHDFLLYMASTGSVELLIPTASPAQFDGVCLGPVGSAWQHPKTSEGLCRMLTCTPHNSQRIREVHFVDVSESDIYSPRNRQDPPWTKNSTFSTFGNTPWNLKSC